MIEYEIECGLFLVNPEYTEYEELKERLGDLPNIASSVSEWITRPITFNLLDVVSLHGGSTTGTVIYIHGKSMLLDIPYEELKKKREEAFLNFKDNNESRDTQYPS